MYGLQFVRAAPCLAPKSHVLASFISYAYGFHPPHGIRPLVMPFTLKYEDYTIAWIAILRVEAEAALAVLDKQHDGQFLFKKGDDYIYLGGEINKHDIVIATLPEGQAYGIGSASALAIHIKTRFPNIWFCLLVGLAAGLPNLTPKFPFPSRDIRLGDLLVCIPDKADAGIVQYDLGHNTDDGFTPNGRVAETPAIIRSAIRNIRLTKPNPFMRGNEFACHLVALQNRFKRDVFYPLRQEEDQLFENTPEGTNRVERQPRDESHRTRVRYGRLGSGNSLMRNSDQRNKLRD